MQPPTAMPTRTLGVAGRVRAPTPMLHTVGETAAVVGDRTHTAVVRPSVAGAATLVTLVAEAGVHAPRAHKAGVAVAVAADGAGEASEVAAAVALAVADGESSQDQEPHIEGSLGGSKCST